MSKPWGYLYEDRNYWRDGSDEPGGELGRWLDPAYLNRLEALAALGAEEVDLSRLHPWDFEAKYGRKPDLRDLRDRYDAIARPARAEEV